MEQKSLVFGKNNPKVLIVGGLHGDEPTGVTVAEYFRKHPAPGISAIVAHPEAIAKSERFLETDLNRSFAPAIAVSLEEQLAMTLKRNLTGFDFLIDMHNTKDDFTTCAITTIEPTNDHLLFARHFGFKRLVVMPPSGSLIAIQPQKSISFEIALNERKSYSVEMLVEKIKRLSRIDESGASISVFKHRHSVKSITLKRLGMKPEDIRNFEKFTSEQKRLLGLAGEKKYYPIFAKKKFTEGIGLEIVEILA